MQTQDLNRAGNHLNPATATAFAGFGHHMLANVNNLSYVSPAGIPITAGGLYQPQPGSMNLLTGNLQQFQQTVQGGNGNVQLQTPQFFLPQQPIYVNPNGQQVFYRPGNYYVNNFNVNII